MRLAVIASTVWLLEVNPNLREQPRRFVANPLFGKLKVVCIELAANGGATAKGAPEKVLSHLASFDETGRR
jgi:hypothetical protein